jgi:subtilisin family serine protease
MMTKPKAALAAIAMVAAAAVLLPHSAGSSPARGGPPAPGGPPLPARGGSVTLLTGDRVVLAPGGGVSVVAGPGRGGVTFQQLRDARGHVEVIPSDALSLLRAGTVERRLFDVSALIEQGYTDDRTAALPLLVQHARGAALPAAARAGGARQTRTFPGLGLSALAEPRARAGEFWRSVRGTGAQPRALAGGVTRIWLNGQVRASLDQSVPQIGAPQVWATGDKGAGVTVAVLDTGYATDHPDLAGAVTASRGFTAAGPDDVTDRFGHGTHVASIVAGRGTASAGRYTGVAPAASLVIGKVLGDDGSGTDDQVIAGMEWAAAEQHARVVNLSLGGAVTDGTDPLSQALDTLTAQTGALFVVAAGNDGADRTVNTPGAAGAALTVGSVTKQDALSDFSSRGPRLGDDALKPDLVAPGSDIVAARAAGTPAGDEDPVGDSYARLSGTSMAAPHVAGAAALLAAQHPDWHAAQLKAALMTSTKPLDGSPYAVGTGRLDVAAATRETVTADTGSLDLGRLTWPYPSAPVTRTVTFRSDTATTLALALDTPAFTVAPASLAIPAHGSATATVTLVTREAGLPSGRLTATPGTGPALHLTVGASLEGEAYDLSVHTVARTGGVPPTSEVFVYSRADRFGSQFGETDAAGDLRFRVPVGTYDVGGFLPEPAGPLTAVAQAAVAVTAPTTVTLDARPARPVTVAVRDEPSARLTARGEWFHFENLIDLVDIPVDEPFYALPGAAPGVRLETRTTWSRPDVTIGTAAADFATTARPATGTRTLPVVDAGHATPAELATLDVRGKLVLVRYTDEFFDYPPWEQAAAVAKLGAAAVVFPAFRGGSWLADPEPIPVLLSGAFDALAAGPPSTRLTVNPASPYAYHLNHVAQDRLPGGTTYTAGKAGLARVDTTYRALGAAGEARTVDMPADGVFFNQQVTADLPMLRAEYYTPGSWVSGVNLSRFVGEGDESAAPAAYAAGRAYRAVWNVAVIAPRVGEVTQGGGTVSALIFPYSDAVAGHTGNAFGSGDTGDLVLSRDGADLGAAGNSEFGTWTVPAGSGTYRLRQTTGRNQDGWNLSTASDTTWTFPARDGTLPLLELDYQVPLDEHNAMPADHPAGFAVIAAARDLRCAVSFDDGGTWHELAVHHAGDRFLVSPPVGGARGGTVSLRVTASDAAGSAVTQTVTRAFALR